MLRCLPALLFLSISAPTLWALAAGSLSGTVRDASTAVVPAASLTITNTALNTKYNTVASAQGLYSFPALPVGRYDLTVSASGFQSQKKTGIAIDADAAVRLD